MKINQKPVLLFAFANDKQTPSGNLDQLSNEWKAIKKIFNPLKEAGLIEFEIIPDATLKDVLAAFIKYNKRIVLFHFAGHANEYSLLLETPFRKSKEINGEGFSDFLSLQKNLTFVFLNGCATQKQAVLLNQKGIPMVIGTDRPVGDTTAMSMAVSFYKFWSSGDSFNEAFEKALAILTSKRENLTMTHRGLGRKPQITTPSLNWHLHFIQENPANLTLMEIAQEPLFLLPKIPYRPIPDSPFPKKQQAYSEKEAYFFWGRDNEIVSFYTSLISSKSPSCWLLYGPPGVGKTSFLQAGIIPRLEQEYKIKNLTAKELLQIIKEKGYPKAEKLTFIFIDDLKELNVDWTNSLEEFLINNPQIRLIFSCQLSVYENLRSYLIHQKIIYDTFYLPSISLHGIESFMQRLEKVSKTVIESNLTNKITQYLLGNKNDVSTPFFQQLLSVIWQKAKEEDHENIHLQWRFYLNWVQKDGWKNYILKQLNAFDKELHNSGFLLEILKETIPQQGTEGLGISHDKLKNKYPALVVDFPRYIQQLINQHLLTESSNYLRLSHQLLIIPLLSLLQESQRPIQEIGRTIAHKLKQRDEDIDERNLDLIVKNKKYLPQFTQGETDLIQKSQKNHYDLRMRKIAANSTKLALTLLALAFGHRFENPYLLLFLILILVLYPNLRKR